MKLSLQSSIKLEKELFNTQLVRDNWIHLSDAVTQGMAV